MTPDYDDIDGLSFTSLVPSRKCVLTTVELMAETGALNALNDHGEHYGVLPIAGDIEEWIETKETAEINPHPYSVMLKNIA